MQGWWWLPFAAPAGVSAVIGHESGRTVRQRLRVVAQCKAEKKKISPKYVRELEGVMLRFFVSPAATPTTSQAANMPDDILQHHQFPLVALLISESPFTKSTLLRAHSSPLPLFLLHLPPPSECEPAKIQGSDSNPGSTTSVGSGISRGTNIGSAFWNPALAGPRGVLGGEMEMRWERSLNGQHSRPGIWWRNQRLANWVPANGIPPAGAIRLPNGHEI